MADIDDDRQQVGLVSDINSLDDDRPIALRRKRRTSASSGVLSSPIAKRVHRAHIGLITPPATPRTKKRVRFSDPGPTTATTGLTPFVRRTSLGTPSNLRRNPVPSTALDLCVDGGIPSGTLQFEPLRQILGGRDRRRLRRNRLSEEVHIIESEQRDRRKREHELSELKAQLEQKDHEISSLRHSRRLDCDGGAALGSASIVATLEAEVLELRSKLAECDSPAASVHDWTFAARDPYDIEEDWDVQDFDDGISDIVVSTPSRRPIPSPPFTAPTTPSGINAPVNASSQTELPNSQADALQDKVESLEEELTALQVAIELSNTTYDRLLMKLQFQGGQFDDLDAALDKVLTDLALSQASSIDSLGQFNVLAAAVQGLGFPGPVDSILQTLQAQFRHARIELERLHPGETPEGFENSKLLDLLLNRVRVLTHRVQEQDADIDRYQQQEILLQQQLSARVDVARAMELEAKDQESSNRKLVRALDSYRLEVQNLEELITNLEADHERALESIRKSSDERLLTEQLDTEALRASHEGKAMLVEELTSRLSTTVSMVSELQKQLAKRNTAIASHGKALALSDARVSELRLELERVNASLRDAHNMIMCLRNEKSGLENELTIEKQKLTEFMMKIQAQLKDLVAVVEDGQEVELERM